MSKKIYVVKASGKKEPFSEKKLRASIRRAGIPEETEGRVIDHIQGLLYNGIPTSKIYSQILSFLGESSYPQAKSRYSLKQSIMDLGPSGYPFEKFLAEIFQSQGYQTQLGTVIHGKCTKHEIDIVASKDKDRFLVECKFHNRPGLRTDIKVALYVKARFDDIITVWEKEPERRDELNQSWLATNTKFTSRVKKFCHCAGIKLLGWNYPEEESLRDLIQRSGLHPITCLFSLSQKQKERLLEKGIVLCQQFKRADKKLLHEIGLSSDEIKKVSDEAELVIQLAN